jgi:hypothetical protein
MNKTKVGRDSEYRITALKLAVMRAGQDGGLEGGFEVLPQANVYYQWLTGKTDLKDPALEMVKKNKKEQAEK